MRSSIVVVDDFYADPLAVRDYALRQRWYFPYYPDSEVLSGRIPFAWASTWFREAADCPFKSSVDLLSRLQDAVGEEIDLDHWKGSFPLTGEGKPDPDCVRYRDRTCLWNCSFHLKSGHYDQRPGTGVHNHVEDRWNGVGADGWAGVVYLSPRAPLAGGMNLWRNIDPSRNLDIWTPADRWEQVDSLGNVFNRLVLVRGDMPHSGAKGWGHGLEDGRLFQTFFFRVVEPRHPASVGPSGLS